MYLKRLELFGFKSFANKTELVFEPAVTAVVGPNGCGKSNISDSIKWVLGEQSAKELRGSKMEDIIFNGTDDTQPVNLAEVSLILSNKDRILPVDYDEVIITRRSFRSGESEYLLNKTQVRLKDIMDILAGTGIGVSSYSIAEQGKMDRVLNAKPEDRREIFEEASGITKYKARRREALLKLEHTEQNLTRIADIINEVKRQISSIERQAQKAEKFKIEFERLKEMDLKLAYYDYNKVKDDEGSIKDSNEALKQKEAHLSLEINLKQDELRIQREKITSLDEKISQTRQHVSEIVNSIDKNENDIRLSRERITELNTHSESLGIEAQEIEKRIAEMTRKVESVESEFKLINDERGNRQKLLLDSENILSEIVNAIKQCEDTIKSSKLSIMDNAAKQAKVKNDLSKLSAALSTASSRHRRLNIEKEKTGQEISSLEERLSTAEGLYKEQKSALDDLLMRLSSLKAVYDQLNINSGEKASLIEKLKQRLASSSSKLEVLKDLKERKEGFSEGVKAYMGFIEKNQNARDSFIGVIADMIDVKEGFVTAVESALGEKSQMIVLKNRSAVREAIGYLRDNRCGRAQFIGLDEVPPARSQESNRRHPSVIARLTDLIKTDSSNAKVLSYLLKDTYLATDTDMDNSLKDSGMTLITKDGCASNGIVTSGGSNSREEYTSIIGRDAKIRELSKESEALKKEIVTYEAEYQQMQDRIAQINIQVKNFENSVRDEEIKLKTKEAERDRILEQKDKLKEEAALIQAELEEITEEEDSLKQGEDQLKSEFTLLEDEHNGLESAINESQSSIALKLAEKEKTIVNLTEMRTKMALIDDKFNSQNETLSVLRGSLSDERQALQVRKTGARDALAKAVSLKEHTEHLDKENKDLASRKDEISSELSKVQEERRQAHAFVEDIEKKIRLGQKELDELRNSISTYHINMNELSYKANNIKEKILAAYKIDIEQERVASSCIDDWEKIRTDVEQLRQKIENMGPVNLVAIEEHKELQDRYEFLTTQQQDLLNAKESLHKAINTINRTTRKMFLETFEQIRGAFKDYFKLLFGGGQAELFLVDQTDILESGIEIVVRPPGKKLQSISLLSGGEKALTSVALLFSLFKVRPTPFCILDEIDAPLDEANVERFGRMLQEFIKHTQFIIITHNKKTISMSDVMYGITMEKSGVSKIISVKFAADKKKEPQTLKIDKPAVTGDQTKAQARLSPASSGPASGDTATDKPTA